MSVRATLPNPFRQRTIADLWQPPEVDLLALHQASFENCSVAFAKLRAENQSNSLLLYGEPGNGKSHLLARMLTGFWQANVSNDYLNGNCWTFVTVNLQNAQMLSWQYLQTCVANDLLRLTPSGVTQLERLLLSRLAHYGLVEGDGRVWLEKLRKDARSVTAFSGYLDDVFEALDDGNLIAADMRRILRYLLLGFNQRQASAWLRGEALPPLILEQLSLSRLPTDEAALEEHARRVVLALCLLVTPQMPYVFCFDQVEALQQDPEDVQGLGDFLEIFRTLRAQSRCTLLIASTQSAFRDPLRRALRKLEAEHKGELTEVWLAPLTWRDAQQLIELRLDSVPVLARMREERKHDRFWPLDEADILTGIGFQARQLLVHCATLYEQSRPAGTSGALQQARTSGKLHSGKLGPKEHAQFKQLWLERYNRFLPEMKDDDSFDERLVYGLRTLVSFARPDWKMRTDELPRDVDLLFEGPEHNVQIVLCNHTHLPSYTKRVQRVLERFYGHRTYVLVMLRDIRRAFGPMSRTPRKLREEMVDRGAIWIDVTPEMQAALETLHELFTESEAGDQGCRGICEWAVITPTNELKRWLEEIFPAESEDAYDTGKLA